jgi:hypothetical protein
MGSTSLRSWLHKKNAKVHIHNFIVYQPHLGTGDGSVPLNYYLNGLNLNDSQLGHPISKTRR